VVATGSCTSPATFDLTTQPDGAYTLSVIATDPAGNASAPATSTYTLDRAQPAPPALAGGPGPVGSDPTPTWSFTTEPGAALSCELRNGPTVVAPTAACTNPVSFDLSAQPDGTYTLSVIATDPAANASAPASVDYVLDRLAPPAPTLTSTPPASGTDPTPTWSFTGEPGAGFECQLRRGTTVVVDFAPCADPATYDLSTQPNGDYTFTLRQRDPAGNTSAPVSSDYTWARPPAPPTTTTPPAAGGGGGGGMTIAPPATSATGPGSAPAGGPSGQRVAPPDGSLTGDSSTSSPGAQGTSPAPTGSHPGAATSPGAGQQGGQGEGAGNTQAAPRRPGPPSSPCRPRRS
jgi:hypothetical protein